MKTYRFRVDDGKLVLQVAMPRKNDAYVWRDDDPRWRDATVEDIPVADPFDQRRQESRLGRWPIGES